MADDKGTTWIQRLCGKFEDFCLDVEDLISEEALSYVNDNLQIMGVNVRQLCSECMQDVPIPPSGNTMERPPSGFSQVKASEYESYEMSNAVLDQAQSTKIPLNTTYGLCSSSEVPVEHIKTDLSLKQNAKSSDQFWSSSYFETVRSSEPLEMPFDDSKPKPCARNILPVGSCQRCLVTGSIDGSIAEETRFNSNAARGAKESVKSIHKLDESCVMVDVGEVYDGSHEVEKSIAYKKKAQMSSASKKVLTDGKNSEHDASWHYFLLHIDYPTSSVKAQKSGSLDDESNDLEWEII